MDRRLTDKLLRRLDKLRILSSSPRLSLRTSPPYLPHLLSETSSLLLKVLETYRGSRSGGPGPGPGGDEITYLNVHVKNLLDKTDRALLLFKEGRDQMFEEASSYRRNLTKLALLFSHMLWELRALFPGGRFHGDTYRLVLAEAQDFWTRCFGSRCLVPWDQFTENLRQVQDFQDGMESMALKSTMDLTCNHHVSVFEFDVFTRLFQPFRTLIRNWTQLAVTHPGYMAFLTYDQVVARLENHLHRPGSYIYRLSCSRMGQWAIGHVTTEGGTVQTIPENTPLYEALRQGFKEGCYLYPDGRDLNPDTTSLCEPTETGKLTVTEEQYELYCDIGSTFQLCKICSERDKDTRIQPCGHLLCQYCLTGWQKSSGHTCPYCRCKIRGTETVAIKPYLSGSSQWEKEEQEEKEKEEQEEEEEDDHEDIEVIVKEMAALRKFSSLDYQVPSSHRSAPLLPPKISRTPRCPSPCSQSQSSETSQSQSSETRYSHSSPQIQGGNEADRRSNRWRQEVSSEEENAARLRPPLSRLFSRSSEFLTEATRILPSSSKMSTNSDFSSAASRPRRKHKEREEKRLKTEKWPGRNIQNNVVLTGKEPWNLRTFRIK